MTDHIKTQRQICTPVQLKCKKTDMYISEVKEQFQVIFALSGETTTILNLAVSHKADQVI